MDAEFDQFSTMFESTVGLTANTLPLPAEASETLRSRSARIIIIYKYVMS